MGEFRDKGVAGVRDPLEEVPGLEEGTLREGARVGDPDRVRGRRGGDTLRAVAWARGGS